MAGIFISYRQADAKAWAIGLRDDLAKSFGDDQVFLDKDALGPGNWRDQLQLALNQCSVVLAVIGRQWLTIADEQQRPRITLPDDAHRQEIALALNHQGVTVIPILVDDAAMPKAEQLPDDIRVLTDQQAYKVGDTKARRKADLEVLIKGIESVGGLTAKSDVSEAESDKGQSPWYKLDYSAVGIAFVLTVVWAMIAYSSDGLTEKEIPVLLIISYGLALGGKRLWRLISNRRRRVA
ncbi:MAG: toll/interleukin-1 receptor domain-containing protein [Nitrospira sp. LK70]|nr:toll/interleukin-1 receptor domain-containing protein [Nitrospira sp. LK70]